MVWSMVIGMLIKCLTFTPVGLWSDGVDRGAYGYLVSTPGAAIGVTMTGVSLQ